MLSWQVCRSCGDFAGLRKRCRVAGSFAGLQRVGAGLHRGFAGRLLEPPGADGKGQMVTVCNSPGGSPGGAKTTGPDRGAPVGPDRGAPVASGAGSPRFAMPAAGVYRTGRFSPKTVLARRSREPRGPEPTPATCPSTGGRLAREAVHGAFMSHVPCVGCGWCCLSDQCLVSHHLHGYLPRCPELLWNAALDRYLCLLMAPQAQHCTAPGQSPDTSRPDTPHPDVPDAAPSGPAQSGSTPFGPAPFGPAAPGPDLTELRQGLGCCAPLCSWRRAVRDRG